MSAVKGRTVLLTKNKEQMKTRILLLVLIPLISLSTWAEKKEYTGEYNLVYEYDTQTSTAVLKSGAEAEGAITIASQITVEGKNYKVVKIGNDAFYNNAFIDNKKITEVVVSEGIIEIGRVAFSGCSGLRSVVLPESLVSLGMQGAFSGCSSLEAIEIPSRVKTISRFAFHNCSNLKSVVLHSGLEKLQEGAFEECTSLTSIKIPQSVIDIATTGINNAAGVFESCTALEEIVVEKGNTVYDSRNNCNAIIKTETNELITGCKTTIIPDDVTSLARLSFRGLGITEIEIPSSVKKIGESAFSNCNQLKYIVIPEGVESLEGGCFYCCKSFLQNFFLCKFFL